MGYLGTGRSFWEQVDKTNSCWLWTGAANAAGYGTAYDPATQRVVGAHRFAYEDLVGPVPDGRHLDHLCKVRLCVNPSHVEPVTPRENVMRGTAPTSLNAVKTHCDHGHAFTPENTYTPPRRPNRRYCLTCRREADRKRKKVA